MLPHAAQNETIKIKMSHKHSFNSGTDLNQATKIARTIGHIHTVRNKSRQPVATRLKKRKAEGVSLQSQ